MSTEFKCNLCGQTFGSQIDLQNHRIAAHGEGQGVTEEQKRLDEAAQREAEARQRARTTT
jgi:hypothetical protein